MANGVEFTCPNCGKKNFIALAKVKKNLKGAIPFTLACGCGLSPFKILDKLAAQLESVLGKTKPKAAK